MNLNNTLNTLGALVEGLRRDPSGTTVSVRARRPLDSIDGYVVGGFHRTFEAYANENPFDILETPNLWGCLVAWLQELPDNTSHVGAWLNEGTYYFDSVKVYTDFDIALKIAKNHGEKAIWDGIRQVEIPTEEPSWE
jgi:hypothetical protein